VRENTWLISSALVLKDLWSLNPPKSGAGKRAKWNKSLFLVYQFRGNAPPSFVGAFVLFK
jgi:hypothetical protein